VIANKVIKFSVKTSLAWRRRIGRVLDAPNGTRTSFDIEHDSESHLLFPFCILLNPQLTLNLAGCLNAQDKFFKATGNCVTHED
jgi:hypothetical protein